MVRAALALVSPLLFAAAVAAPAASAPSVGDNVSITLTVGRVGAPDKNGERTYKFVGQEGQPARILMGWRTPIPTRSAEGKEAEPASTSYVYQNVGLTADLEAHAVGDQSFLVSGTIEISGAREGGAPSASGKPPLIGTFNQALHVLAVKGKKLRVAEGPDPEGGTLYLDMKVDLLD